jgi:hypothetical protein
MIDQDRDSKIPKGPLHTLYDRTRFWIDNYARLHWFHACVFPMILIMLTLSSCSSDSTIDQVVLTNDYPNSNLLVTPDWLNEHLDDPQMRIIDMRSPESYSSAHIPGAINVTVSDHILPDILARRAPVLSVPVDGF